MSIQMLNLPQQLFDIRSTGHPEHVAEFADDFINGRLSVFHPHVDSLEELIPRDWELALVLICLEAADGTVYVLPHSFDPEYPGGEVLATIDIRTKFLEYCERSNVPVPTNLDNLADWPRPSTAKTLGALLICRHHGVWDTVGLYPTDIGTTVGFAFHVVSVVASIPECRSVIAPEESIDRNEWVDATLQRILTPRHPLAPPEEGAPAVTTVEPEVENLFFRARRGVGRIGHSPKDRYGLRTVLKQLGSGQLEVWRGGKNADERLLSPDSEMKLVVMFGLTGWDCGECDGHLEPVLYQEPRILTAKQHGLIWNGFAGLWSNATHALILDEDDQDEGVPNDLFAAWVVTVHPDRPLNYHQFILLHRTAKATLLLSELREEMNQWARLTWE